MRFIQRLGLIVFLISGVSLSASAQKTAPDVLLTVGGEVDHPLKLTHARWVRQVKSLTIVRAPKSVGGGQ